MSSEPPVILITGCSTGFGRSLTQEALVRGMKVIATARRLSAITDLQEKGAKTFVLDVNDKPEEQKKFAEKAISAFGKVDILVNNAGWLLSGAIEENSPEEVQSQFNTNFFAVLNITNAFMPHFRIRKTGTIVNISSQGSYLALSGAGIYSATKAALDCVTETWADELAPFNIRAVSVNLGAFRTSVASSNSKPPQNNVRISALENEAAPSIYDTTEQIEGYDKARNWHKMFQERSGHEIGDPDKGARKLLDLVTMRTDKPLPVRFALGEDAVHLIRNRLENRITELDEWRSFGIGTNIDGMKYEHADW